MTQLIKKIEFLRSAVEEEFGPDVAQVYFEESEENVDDDVWVRMSISDIVHDVDLYLMYT